MNTTTFNTKEFQQELITNILPFWLDHSRDKDNGGFFGALTINLQPRNEIPRSAILCSRILWTFSTAFKNYSKKEYREMADYAYQYLINSFMDKTYGGLFWEIDPEGQPVTDRKHHYAQAFAIYSLCEYFTATGKNESLDQAKELFNLLEKHGHDQIYLGTIEGSSRDWSTLTDMRLSPKDMNCIKSMNTMLHILEAYTSLLCVWPDEKVRERLIETIDVFLAKIIDPETNHLKLFFDEQWNSMSKTISFGHDIECSWLLWEAALMTGDQSIMERTKKAALQLAESVLLDGMDKDGSIFQEWDHEGKNQADKEWWTQAEGIVGFYNTYQLTGDFKYLEAAKSCWKYIQEKLIDHTYGGWIKRIKPDGKPNLESFKIGPWECPYHDSRMCLEMIKRLEKSS